ncbi:flagellar biosynthetic protein FliO [Devosia sp. YIM 151766]|uniref:flagellar biosynthetic protein FliO n=1 Tax=Devosia sp. YIM 151766 TaxID=3017325 RepID=UPI00255D07A0|nr:flagellar biosynthetic protein FliO [Devosia sp. YIM 151766]WIY54346.1 flagellar biosynthetic protein FliO [Devosia sp. YIM 151766]
MQFITGLFGGSGNTILTMLFALGAVIVLIVLAVWLMKVVFKVSSNGVRGRSRRLGVVETLALDQKRQLMIVRRDNVEHVILTGGPQDLVVETGIAVEEAPVAQPARRPLPQPPMRRPTPGPAPAPVPVVETVRPAAAVPKGEPDTLLEHLQKAGHAGDRKTRVSLRRTGLMRQTEGQEGAETGQNPDISAVSGPDSANETRSGEITEGAALEHDGRDEAKQG